MFSFLELNHELNRSCRETQSPTVLHDLTLISDKGRDNMGCGDKAFVSAERPAACGVLSSPLLSCMCGRTVGIFNRAIFRSPLVGSDRRTAKKEQKVRDKGTVKIM